MQNAETAAWGRAIVAALAADTKKGIASSEEVRNRQQSPMQRAKGELVDALSAASIDPKAFAAWALTPNGGSLNIAATDSVPAVQKLIDRVKKDADTIRAEVSNA